MNNYVMQMFKIAIADTMLKISTINKAKDVKVAGELYAILMERLEEMLTEEELRMLEEIDLEDIEEISEAEAEELIAEAEKEANPKKKGGKNVK